MQRLAVLLSALVAATGSLALHAAAKVAPAPGEHWVSTWATAQQFAPINIPKIPPPPPNVGVPPPGASPIPPYPDKLNNQTIRMIVRASVGGRKIRLQLSNALGNEPLQIGAAHVALHDSESRIVEKTDRAVTFDGNASVTVLPGAMVVSDPIELAAPALAQLAVSLYLPSDTVQATVHPLGLHTTYIVDGNAVANADLPGASTNRSYFWLAGVEVLAPRSAAAIVAFGDSITDGFSTTADKNRAWPDLLAAELQARAATRSWSVLNLGISGNRIRRDGAGTSALARFDRDVLARPGVRWMIMLEGINDINLTAFPGISDSEQTTAAQIIQAYAQIVDRAHLHGIKVMGVTIMPEEGLWLYTEGTEAMRQAVNQWIRSSGKFDVVADFDAATRDPASPGKLKQEFDSGDHIHPNDAGNAAMANSIDIGAFSR